MREHGLPRRDAVGRRPAAEPRVGAHRLWAVDLFDIDDLPFVQHGQVNGLAGIVGEPTQRIRCDRAKVQAAHGVKAEFPQPQAG